MSDAILMLLTVGLFVLIGFLAVREEDRIEICVTQGNQWVSGNCIDGGNDE